MNKTQMKSKVGEKVNGRSEKMIGNKNHLQYLDTLDAIKYLIKNTVYADEWTGAGMYEAIVKVVPSKKVKITFLNQLLEEAKNF